jgi:MscS family membrane protein
MNYPIRIAFLLFLIIQLVPVRASETSKVATTDAPAAGAYLTAVDAIRTFLTAFPDRERERPDRIVPDAIGAIDFSGSLALLGNPERRDIAIQLKSVIDRLRYIDYKEVEEEVGTSDVYVVARTTRGTIRMRRMEDGNWRFTSRTIEELPLLLDDVANLSYVGGVTAHTTITLREWLQSQMPPALRKEWLYLEHWQWLMILAMIAIGVLVDWTVVRASQFVARQILRGLSLALEQREIISAVRPLGLVAMATYWYANLHLLILPPAAFGILALAVRVFGSLAFVWAASRMVDLIVSALKRNAERTENRFDDLLVSFIGRIAKLFIVAFCLVFVAQNMGLNITSLLAGLGLGGLAFALAAKDTIENLFGSLTVLMDRPFKVGDWISIPGSIEGVVATVGLRSTRIRTAYDSLITVPNATLIRSHVDNYGERRYRRWRTTIGIQYDTPPAKMEAFCAGIRELVRLHPYTRKDFYSVHMNDFGPSSLDILLNVFFEVPDWVTEQRERHRLFVDIVKLANQLGVQFAFPTRTLHLIQGQNPVYNNVQPSIELGELEGRNSARRILRESYGEAIQKQPPPRFEPPESTTIPPEER